MSHFEDGQSLVSVILTVEYKVKPNFVFHWLFTSCVSPQHVFLLALHVKVKCSSCNKLIQLWKQHKFIVTLANMLLHTVNCYPVCPLATKLLDAHMFFYRHIFVAFNNLHELVAALANKLASTLVSVSLFTPLAV